MSYISIILPPLGAFIIFIVALKIGYHKQVLIVTAGIAMVATMFAMKYLSWYGVICTATGCLALVYVVLSLFLSIRERR